jgi:hypothetical protein
MSSIGFASSVRYGLGVLSTGLEYRLDRMGVRRSRRFRPEGRRLAGTAAG